MSELRMINMMLRGPYCVHLMGGQVVDGTRLLRLRYDDGVGEWHVQGGTSQSM